MSRKIGFWSVFAIVTGSQIGSGIFMLPASLAPFGAYSMAGWALSGLGAIMLALVFAKLCSQFPRTGGPHAYVNEAFGPHASFFTGWTYWVISWVSTTAVITASIGYLTPLIGDCSRLTHLGLEIALLLGITAVNFRGVKTAGNVEFFLTALKVIPLLIVPVIGLAYFNPQNFTSDIATSQLSLTQILKEVTMLTLWGFIGLESATTPAGSIENPSKTIPRAVVFGTLGVAVLYMINSLGIMGAMPGKMLMVSKAPYADTVQYLFGGKWYLLISLIAAVVCIGTLNAWMLASGQIALGLAQDGLMPERFARKNQHGAPIWSLIISCLGIIPLLFLTLNESLGQQINTIIDFSVTAFLFIYAISCLALIKLMWQQKRTKIWHWFYALVALSFCVLVIAATPLKTLMVSLMFVLSGLPIFVFRRHLLPSALPQLKTI
jgi:APA family basic amino acid/polyamine antiporter